VTYSLRKPIGSQHVRCGSARSRPPSVPGRSKRRLVLPRLGVGVAVPFLEAAGVDVITVNVAVAASADLCHPGRDDRPLLHQVRMSKAAC
jgi:hypothetical protein